MAILRIVDDRHVEMSGRALVGAERFYFVIDDWAYRAGEADVILACEKSQRRAAAWIDEHDGYTQGGRS